MSQRWPAVVIGSGNIGTDLLVKMFQREDRIIDPVAMVGIDPDSDGLARARGMGVATTDRGIEGLLDMPELDGIKIAFDATSAGAHARHDEVLRSRGIQVLDLTPAAIGPYVVPVVNLADHLDAPNINMVTCGGQATIPMVAAVAAVAPVSYAEIVASIASRSAGPGTRANIDEFTETTARALSVVGGAARGKAIIVLNPAEPPMIMRDTVYCLVDECDEDAVERSVAEMVSRVQQYVPGYRLKQPVQFEYITSDDPLVIPETGKFWGVRITVLLEIEGAAHYLPAYAGNLDIMTSAALATAEELARRQHDQEVAS